MPKFSDKSLALIETISPELKIVLIEAIKHIDFIVICGHRGAVEQDKLFSTGKSQVKYPHSKHNSKPSRAVDIAPYHNTTPHIRWSDKDGFIYLAGIIKGISSVAGIKIRWGGDWDSDNDQQDERFRDLGHFELF